MAKLKVTARASALGMAALFVSIAAPTVKPAAADELGNVFKVIAAPIRALHREKPVTGSDNSIEQLARQIDWLEHHIDKYGSVVAKHPDVWGESRLMRHRYEYEDMMAAQLGAFEVRMNAALRRSDQAFLGMAFALQAAAGDDPPSMYTNSGAAGTEVYVQTLNNMIPTSMDANGTTNTGGLYRSQPFQAITDGQTSAAVPGFSFEHNQISLEPTAQLDQMSRYLNHLHELRRINEGDDTADSPGYALNLVRIPVSILPGKHTRKGYGAEVTIIAEPYLGNDLLPTTFRDLVINDLVDLLAPALTHVVNHPDYKDRKKKAEDAETNLEDAKSESNLQLKNTTEEEEEAKEAADKQVAEITASLIKKTLAISLPASKTRRSRLPLPPSQLVSVFGNKSLLLLAEEISNRLGEHAANRTAIHYMDVRSYLVSELQAAYEFLSTEERRGLWYFSGHELASAIHQHHVHWIQQRRCEFLEAVNNVVPGAEAPINECCEGLGAVEPLCKTVKVALAWSILVESALLDKRLTQDIREIGTAKGCAACIEAAGPFYGPDPSIEARYAFNEYVKCRWPIRVFALDPVNQEQNVADEYARRRELQVAMAVAFASGQLNAQALMRFARRLEWDMATIDLNRTVVGFSHGNDTFGWRFNPRFQTPPVRGTLATFGETLFGGPNIDADLRQRQLEPGIRECTAVVVMPSFVPYCTFDVRTNWYCLTHPAQTELSMKDTMVLSRSIKSMQQSAAACAKYAHLYRDGEVHRLLRRVDQLDRELPLQTMRTQIPYENTAGGFELFNTGVTDLAPELLGWYGAPGINPNGVTSMYIMGDGFSVHDTRLIAGGQSIPFRLLSRQVMEVQIPPGLQVMRDAPNSDTNFDEVVDMHVATAYGASSHLLIPVAKPSSQLAVGAGNLSWQPTAGIVMGYTVSGDGKDMTVTVSQDYFQADPHGLAITVPRSAPLPVDNVDINFYLHHGGVYVGTFTKRTFLELDIQSDTYRITGSDLKDLVLQGSESFQGVTGGYLTWLAADRVFSQPPAPISVTAELVVNGRTIRVLGSFNISLKNLSSESQ